MQLLHAHVLGRSTTAVVRPYLGTKFGNTCSTFIHAFIPLSTAVLSIVALASPTITRAEKDKRHRAIPVANKCADT